MLTTAAAEPARAVLYRVRALLGRVEVKGGDLAHAGAGEALRQRLEHGSQWCDILVGALKSRLAVSAALA